MDNEPFTNTVTQQTFTYTGEVANGVPHGQGTGIYYETEGLPEYQGSWENGLPNGYGEYLCCDGFSYQGFWKDSLMAGNGTINNDIKVNHVEGAIIRGDKTYDSNRLLYQCNYLDPPFIYTGMLSKDGVPTGNGVATFIGSKSRFLNITSQVWFQCKENGHSEVHLRKGGMYRGYFSAGNIEDSQGIYMKDGVEYVGEYKDNSAVGVHVATYPDGRTELVKPDYSSYDSDFNPVLNFIPCEEDCS